jgi:antitoxin VapB
MGIFIKNPDVERKARELAKRTGQSLTAAIDGALEERLRQVPPVPHRPTAQEMLEATERFRKAIGLDKVEVKPLTKKEWDDMWPTGIPEFDEP